MRKTIQRLIITVVAFAVLAVAVYSAPMVVTVDRVAGTVQFRAGDTAPWKNLSNGDKVPVGAMVRTQADSSCILKWADGNAVKVAPLTVMKLTEADKAASGQEKSALDLTEGKVFAHVKKMVTKDSSFQLKTPTAVAGVRGTDLYGTESPSGGSSFGVTEGNLTVQSGEAEVEVDPGLSVNITEEGSISPPEPIPPEIKDEVEQNLSEVREAGEADEAAGAGAAGEAAGEEEEAGDSAGTIEQIFDQQLTTDIVEQAGNVYKTGAVDVIISIDQQ